MKYIAEHFGPAVTAFVIIFALAVVVVGIINSPFIAEQFEGALTQFFSNMNGIQGA